PDVQVAKTRSRLAKLVLDHLSNARPLLHHDQRFGLQLVEGNGLAGKAMLGRAGKHDLVPEERFEHDSTVTAARADDAELELAVGDAVDERLRVGDGEPNSHIGMLLLKLAKEQRNDGPARARGGAEVEGAGKRALLVL